MKNSDALHQQSKTFAKYARETLGIRRLKDLNLMDVGKWLAYRRDCGDSPSTLKTRAAAMAKVLRCSSTDLGFKCPIRRSEDIKRSRNPVKMDDRLDKDIHADIITVAKGNRYEAGRTTAIETVAIRDSKWTGIYR